MTKEEIEELQKQLDVYKKDNECLRREIQKLAEENIRLRYQLSEFNRYKIRR